MEMDLDALLFQEDSLSDDELCHAVSVDESKSDVTFAPSRPDSPCSVECQQLLLAPKTRRRTGKRRVVHRESMARYRQQQRERIDALTAQEMALQRILLQVLAHKKPVVGSDSHSGGGGSLQEYQNRFTELIRVREMLRREQNELNQAVTAHDQRLGSFQTILAKGAGTGLGSAVPLDIEIDQRLRRLLSRAQIEDAREMWLQVDDDAASSVSCNDGADEMERTTGHWITFLEHELRLFYENESQTSSGRIIRQGLDAIQAVHDALSDPRKGGISTLCLGWKAEQTKELDSPGTGRPRLQMRFTKRIPRSRSTLQELQDKTWVFLNSPELIARVNNGAVTAVVAQQLNDDTIILLRNSPDKALHKRFRYFSLNARMWSTDGGSALVLMLVLDKEARLERALEDELPEIRWMKQGGSCLRFSQPVADPESLEIEYTGYIESVSADHAAQLLVANASALLRWEHLVVPPRLLG